MSEIKDVTKDESVYLEHVFNYMDRSIGVRYITTTDDLEKSWENAQFELSAKYQYEGINEHVWDYYLVFCCNFNDEDLDKRLRFKIESDRFCCRKYFLFGTSKRNFSKKLLVEHLFPLINSSNPIQIIKPETIIENLDADLKNIVTSSFFTDELEISEAEYLLETIIAKEGAEDGA